jgi:hypothetical protein
MNQGLVNSPRGQPAPWPRRLVEWLTQSYAGDAVLLLLAVAFGCTVIWALHPTFPPQLSLLEPEEGTWNWLLHEVFGWGRVFTALAVVATVIGLLGWWMAQRLPHRR